jgi:uncharacterized protein (DUF934 family)
MTASILHADGTWRPDPWRIVREGDGPARDGDVLPLARWLALPEGTDRARIGAWLAPDQDPEALQGTLAALALIAVEFPTFRDGRGYSTATLLRTRYGYRGELRSIGDVLVDQVFYMKRVGFSSFALRADQKPAYAEAALRAFGDAYQASVDRPLPHYRRRGSATPATPR